MMSDVAKSAVVVGHNPGISHLATCLGNNGKNYSMPTCSLVHLQFKINRWQELSIGSGQVLDFVIP
jgi:phosphohistidine phosphatase